MLAVFPEALHLKIMMVVIDACVAIKFITSELGTVEANLLLASENDLVAPELMLIETAHGLWKKVAADEIRQADAVDGLAKLPQFFEPFVPAAELLPDAQALSFLLDHGVYDCLYLALAIREQVQLVTADRKFWNAARRAKLDAHVQLFTWPGQGT